jgi:DNA polymerase-3 subunit epsilon
MLREIVLDTETTGLDPDQGHRLVEVAGVELINHLPSGKTFHSYVNPERDMPEEAFRVHGLSAAFLADYPAFAEVIDPLLEFLGDSPLVIHNAAFDVAFLNHELDRCKRGPLSDCCAGVLDSLRMAKDLHPGKRNGLDALCERYQVDNSARTLHGALLDAQLLAQVYVELTGGRQIGLGLVADTGVADVAAGTVTVTVRELRPARPHSAAAEELERHRAFIAQLVNPLWARFA